MSLTPEEIAEAKRQLKQQIQHLPPEQKVEALEQINSLSDEAIEEMLEQQKNQPQIFRRIINKEIPSVSIGENEKAVAVLSTKSISKGHTIIIPKNPVQDLSELEKETRPLSEDISKKLLENLKAKSTSVIPERSFGEMIMNIIPIYDKPLSLQSPKKDTSVEDLEKIKSEINVIKLKQEPEKIKIKKKRGRPKVLKLKKRVP